MTNHDFEVVDGHNEWLELCALATSGALEHSDAERLRVHLRSCPQCRAALMEFGDISREAMPLVADEYIDLDDEDQEPADAPAWDVAAAKHKLLAALDQPQPAPISVPSSRDSVRRPKPHPAWIATAAAITLAVGLGTYQLGKRATVAPQPMASPLLAQMESLTAEKSDLDNRLRSETQTLEVLQKQVGESQQQVSLLQTQLQDSKAESSNATAAKTGVEQQLRSAVGDRDALLAKLQAAQVGYQAVQDELTRLKTQRQQDQLHYASLEYDVTDLRRRLHDAEGRESDATQYLASDRDIRDLIGARNLYIADVTDLDPNGNRRAPFGRVFYTKGKSLIFYAFDLNQQPKVKETSIFQAWARQGSDTAKPVSLGILYMDSEANRRWILKTEDPKVLEQINTVFVTVEPRGGSQKPTGKPLLYAYLRSQAPNHP